LAEDEENLLVPGSPTLAMLNHPEAKNALFPRGVLRKVISRTPGDAVAHASLIFHHHCYNPLIKAWYDDLRPQLTAAM
jgi:hypothetical protein